MTTTLPTYHAVFGYKLTCFALPPLTGSNRNKIASHKWKGMTADFQGSDGLCAASEMPRWVIAMCADAEPAVAFWMAGILRKTPWGYFYGIYWLFCCSADWFLHRLRYCFVDIVPWDKFILSPFVWPVYWRHVQWTLVGTAWALTNWRSVFWGSWQQLAHYLLS